MEQLRHVGYNASNEELQYFSSQNIKLITAEISSKFKGTNVVIIPEVVKGLLEKNYYDYKPPQTDIYGRYQIQPFTEQDKFSRAREITVNMLISEIQSRLIEYKTAALLDIDVIKYTGELKQHPKIKVKERRPPSMQINLNY